jgi:hypothetical protein
MIRLLKPPKRRSFLFFIFLTLIGLSLTSTGLRAQSSPGYTRIAQTNGLSYIDTSVTPGAVYDYQVTAYNPVGESGPITTNPAVIPSLIGLHNVLVAWTLPSICSATLTTLCGGTPTGYNVYRVQFVIPFPPGSASATSGP